MVHIGPSVASDSLTRDEAIAYLFGFTATAAFTTQYLPQAYKNFKRGSVAGFSTTGIIIKLWGAAFLCVNSIFLQEGLPVLIYGLVSLLQHTVFILQFARYTGSRLYLLWLPVPLLPYLLATHLPWTVVYTSSVKPLSQIVSHFPQLWVCYKLQSTSGVSMMTHHLNIVGGVCGMLSCGFDVFLLLLTVCFYVPPKNSMTLVMYMNSLFQAISIYLLAWRYDGSVFPAFDPAPKLPLLDTSPSTSPSSSSSASSVSSAFSHASSVFSQTSSAAASLASSNSTAALTLTSTSAPSLSLAPVKVHVHGAPLVSAPDSSSSAAALSAHFSSSSSSSSLSHSLSLSHLYTSAAPSSGRYTDRGYAERYSDRYASASESDAVSDDPRSPAHSLLNRATGATGASSANSANSANSGSANSANSANSDSATDTGGSGSGFDEPSQVGVDRQAALLPPPPPSSSWRLWLWRTWIGASTGLASRKKSDDIV